MRRTGLLLVGLVAAITLLTAPAGAGDGAARAGDRAAGGGGGAGLEGDVGSQRVDPAAAGGDLVEEGRRLYLQGCSSCHGAEGTGGPNGPTLVQASEASAFYYLSTGRMPLGNDEQQPRRKPPVYDDAEIAALVAYVASLGAGPAQGGTVPDVERDPADIDLALGGERYRDHCQPCHSATGAGGALTYGWAAPQLAPATPREVAAAMRAGPGEMPVFGPDVLSDEEVAQIAHYVDYLSDPDDRGGVPLGRTGPVAEGFVAWIFGMGALLGIVAWIGTRA